MRNAIWICGLLHIVLWRLSLPPFDLWFLAFAAPVPLIWICREEKRLSWKAYAVLFGLFFALWTSVFYYLAYMMTAHVLCLVGLSFLTASVETTVFFLIRTLTRGPGEKFYAMLLVVPVAWGLGDTLRAWLCTGYPVGSLCHALYRFPLWIQTADIFGEWGISAWMVAMAVCLAFYRKPQAWAVAGGILLAVWGYGYYRLAETEPLPRVGNFLLIQGNLPSTLNMDDAFCARSDAMYYDWLTVVALKKSRTPDIILYPEGIYRKGVMEFTPDAVCPVEYAAEDGTVLPPEEFRNCIAEEKRVYDETLRDLARRFHAQILTGGKLHTFTAEGYVPYNAVLYASPDANRAVVAARKIHLVPVGEYFPFAKFFQTWCPVLYRLFPKAYNFSAGTDVKVIKIQTPTGELSAITNVCLECVFGRLIRRQMVQATWAGQTPDVIINVSNNGWFRRSDIMELHLASSVFRAVENRRPFLACANNGCSASIDSNGTIEKELGKACSGWLETSIRPDRRQTFYTEYGGCTVWLPLLWILSGLGVRYRLSRKIDDPFIKEKFHVETD